MKGKGKGQTSCAYAGKKGRRRYSSKAFLTFVLEVGVWSAPLEGLFTPKKQWVPGDLVGLGDGLDGCGKTCPDRKSQSLQRNLLQNNLVKTAF